MGFTCKVICVSGWKMRNRKQNRGIGDYQIKQAEEAKWKILEALADGDWYRYKEIREKTNLSSRTLTKHLDRLQEIPIVERKEDVESGKYPVPVLYRIISPFDTYVNAKVFRERFADDIEEMLDETKDPLVILDIIHTFSHTGFVQLLTEIKERDEISNNELCFFGECFLWGNYKILIARLMGESRKLKNELNILQFLKNQAERQIELNTLALQRYKEMEKKNQQA